MDFISEMASDTELEIAEAIFFSNSSISISPFMALLISSTNDVYQSSPIKFTFLSPCIDSNRLSTEDAVFTISLWDFINASFASIKASFSATAEWATSRKVSLN